MSWESLQKQAKYLETKLETEIQRYSSIAQKINADFLCDEENPLMDGKDEQDLSMQIERNLNELSDCIQKMRLCGQLSSHQEGLVKRYTEIHYDYRSEFKGISETIQRKKESFELFKSSKLSKMDTEDSAISRLLRERNSIAASMRSINDMISQAFQTRDALASQRNNLTSATSGLSSINSSGPSFSRLIDSMQKKKWRENMIISVFIGLLLFITIWWVFLR